MEPEEPTQTASTTPTERAKHLRVRIGALTHRRLRHLAADRDVPVGAIIAEAIEAYVTGNER